MKYYSPKSLLLSLFFLVVSVPAIAAENYKLDPMHTNVNWRVSHFGFSSVSGHFGIKEGSIIMDDKNSKNNAVSVVIDTTGLVTGIAKFDEHIKSADFLDVAKYPTATFKSTNIKATGKNTYIITGDFTLHGVTKPITLKAKLNKIGMHPMLQKKSVGFSASTIIKRSEFGIDKYVPNVADDVIIEIECEANLS